MSAAYSDKLYYACVRAGAPGASVAGWPDKRREAFLTSKKIELPVNVETRAVMTFLTKVDKEAWRKNLPVTGDPAVDVPKLKEAMVRYALEGSHRPIWEPKNQAEECGALTYDLAKAALDTVDWEMVWGAWA